MTLRGGYLYHTAAAPDRTVTPLLPEGARNEFTAGIGYGFSDMLRVDAAYQYIRQDRRRGRVEEIGLREPPESVNSGLYSFTAHLFGLTLTARF